MGDKEPMLGRQVEFDRLYAAMAGCPRCGTRPALRLSGWVVQKVAGEPSERKVGSYKCQRRNCGIIYDLTAGAVLAGAQQHSSGA
jgi:hypothetical protein